MNFILTLILFLPLLIFPTSVFAQATTQQQICTNACTAATACNDQCKPGVGADAYAACLCQAGCLCNAEICLQCCEAAGNDDTVLASCNTASQIASGNVISFCGIAALTPGRSCFVYGEGSDGSPTSTYASNSPFPTSVETFISGLFPLENITVSALSQTVAEAGATSGTSQTIPNTVTTTSPSPTASSAASATGQLTAASQKSAAGTVWTMAAKGSMLSLPLVIGFCL